MKQKLFTVILVIAIFATACTQNSSSAPTETINYPATVAVLETNAAVTLSSLQQQTAIAALVSTPTSTSLASDSATPTIAPTVAATQTIPADPYASWVQKPISAGYDVVSKDGLNWEKPKEAFCETDTSDGRYDAICPPKGEHGDWPPHLTIVRFTTPDDLNPELEISFRVNVDGQTVPSQFRLQLAYNPDRTPEELMQDYLAAASQGDLGLFIATETGLMPAGTLTLNGVDVPFGYSCWDCLAHTAGELEPQPIKLNDPSISHMGTPTIPLSGSLLPGLVIPIPSPKDDPDFLLDILVQVPAGTTVKMWLGRYDVPPSP